MILENKLVVEILRRFDKKAFEKAEEIVDSLQLSTRNIIDAIEADFSDYNRIIGYVIKEALFASKNELRLYSGMNKKDVRIIEQLLNHIMVQEYDSLYFLSTFHIPHFLNTVANKNFKKSINVKTTTEFIEYLQTTLKDMEYKRAISWIIEQISANKY